MRLLTLELCCGNAVLAKALLTLDSQHAASIRRTWFSVCTRALVFKMETASAWRRGAARAGTLREMNESLKIAVRSRAIDFLCEAAGRGTCAFWSRAGKRRRNERLRRLQEAEAEGLLLKMGEQGA